CARLRKARKKQKHRENRRRRLFSAPHCQKSPQVAVPILRELETHETWRVLLAASGQPPRRALSFNRSSRLGRNFAEFFLKFVRKLLLILTFESCYGNYCLADSYH